MPSVFVTEMDECEDGEQMMCPRCKKGRLKKIKDGISINGNPYRNYLCTNSVAGSGSVVGSSVVVSVGTVMGASPLVTSVA